jgi:hypothetical protein
VDSGQQAGDTDTDTDNTPTMDMDLDIMMVPSLIKCNGILLPLCMITD